MYCTILIDSLVMHHGRYLTCRNISCVMVSRRVLTKGWKMWQTPLWQFWSKFGHFVHKRVNLASVAARHCMFHLKLSQKLLKYPASVWHLMESGPCHTPKSQVMKWKFHQACHDVTWVMNQSKLYSIHSTKTQKYSNAKKNTVWSLLSIIGVASSPNIFLATPNQGCATKPLCLHKLGAIAPFAFLL